MNIKEFAEPLKEFDLAPVIHAKWEHIERTGVGDKYRCSSCNRLLFVFPNQDIKIDFPYCHCGAKMDEEDSEHAI